MAGPGETLGSPRPPLAIHLRLVLSGGAYLPLDVSYPGHLVGAIVEESECVVVLTSDDQLATRAKEAGASKVLVMKEGWEAALEKGGSQNQANDGCSDLIRAFSPLGSRPWAAICHLVNSPKRSGHLLGYCIQYCRRI
jgi:hypothetical protein